MPPLSASDVAGILERPGGRRSAMLLAGCGFAAPKRAAGALAGLAGLLPERGRVSELVPALMANLSASADPDAALEGLAGLAGSAGAEAGGALLARLAGDAEARRVLVALLSSSRAFSAALERRPEWVEEVISPAEIDAAHSRERLAAELAGPLAAAPDRAARLDVLRRFRRRHALGVAARDASGRADLAATVAELSALADAVIEGALSSARAGTGGAGAPLAVLGLGKLGGNELNYSSDVDLLFIGAGAGAEALRLAEELVRQLAEPTAEGTAYRVDMRLRPEGSAGALVWDREAALAYYRDRARPWERQALVKCRPVAGDLELGRAFLAELESFVWRPGLSPAEVARACRLRADMERATGSAGSVEVKSGAGGIRDVEFSVQILQLAHGAEHPGVRRTGTLAALEALAELGLLEAGRARELRAGYEFLRRVEHCLQTMDELPLHALPADPGERAALARRLGYPGSPESARREFEEDLARHSARLRSIYEEICGQGASGADLAGRLEGLLAAGDEVELAALLSLLGFGGGRGSVKVLRALAERAGGKARLLAPVLERLRAGPGPDRALRNLERLADGGLLARLAAEPELREALLGVLEQSDFLAGLLAARPECLGVLASGAQGRARRGRGPLAAELAELTAAAAGREELAARLAAFRERELVRVGARDLLDGETPEEVSGELGWLAELELERALEAAGVPGEVAVLALGRLGGREMSYGSDLDLVFVDAGAAPDPNAAVLEAARILTAAGYQVDTRLRPAGASGQLVASIAGYRAYRDRGELAVWERLALVRARPVAGSGEARARVGEFLTETLYGAEPPADLAAAAWEMRLRLERTAGGADFKRGPGGLVDLEFLAEYLALAHGPRQPRMRVTGTEKAFDAAAELRLMPAAEVGRALEAHRFLRRLEMRARVLAGRAVRTLPAEEGELARLAGMMDLAGADDPAAALREGFERHTAAARRLLERTLRG